jgi:hypothetical protein
MEKITLLGGKVSCNTEMPMSQTVFDSSPSGITLLASSPVLTHTGSMIIIRELPNQKTNTKKTTHQYTQKQKKNKKSDPYIICVSYHPNKPEVTHA